ncbi:MAG: hypothetical protein HDS43_03160 [Bacteroides sp.]|nr:hypothetical protein [Bacteroides sp.]
MERKEYAPLWAVDSREIIAIGINFSTTRRTIDGWKFKYLIRYGKDC